MRKQRPLTLDSTETGSREVDPLRIAAANWETAHDVRCRAVSDLPGMEFRIRVVVEVYRVCCADCASRPRRCHRYRASRQRGGGGSWKAKLFRADLRKKPRSAVGAIFAKAPPYLTAGSIRFASRLRLFPKRADTAAPPSRRHPELLSDEAPLEVVEPGNGNIQSLLRRGRGYTVSATCVSKRNGWRLRDSWFCRKRLKIGQSDSCSEPLR